MSNTHHKYMIWLGALILTTLVTIWLPATALADGIIIIDPPPVPPPAPIWLTIRYHHVKVAIEGQIATTRIDQVFRNDTHTTVEGTYIFPLPTDAMVQDFMMWVDGRPLESRILPADEARRIYEDYVHRNRDPALLEYVGRQTIQARIFPIPPGQERRIRLQYTQVLPLDQSMLHYRYPLDTERFSNYPLEDVRISVDIASDTPLGALYSPTHQDKIQITRIDSTHAHIAYEAKDLLPDRDFELFIGQNVEDLGAQVLSFRPPGEDGYFLLMLSPPHDLPQAQSVPRDLFLILDTSGSMEGEKLAQVKDGLTYILRHLNPEDRFNIIAFSSQVQRYASTWVPATETVAALDWIEGLEAIGGTNIYLALSEALRDVEPNRYTTLIFLTDGLPTEGIVDEDLLLAAVARETPSDVRIFPFGVGYDVNVVLLDQLALEHQGRATYVTPDQRLDERISAFFARIQSPVMTSIAVEFGPGINIYDLYPTPLPDLYLGTQLIAAGRYRGDGLTTLIVTGTMGDRTVSYRYPVTLSPRHGDSFVPGLWATRKIGYLLTQVRLYGERPEWIEAIVKLSLRYGIITPYTSFLIEEPEHVMTREGREKAADTMQQRLAATPTAVSGAQAVEDAKLRQELGGAESAPAWDPAAEPSTGGNTMRIQRAADHAFICDATLCTDTRFVPDEMNPIPVPFGSQTYQVLLQRSPFWAQCFALAPEVIVVDDDGTTYHFTLEGALPPKPPPTTANPPSLTVPPVTVTPQVDTVKPPSPATTGPISTPENPTPITIPRGTMCLSAWLILVLLATAVLKHVL
ncbi:MAG TPA: VWA domain-containing protein [Chloroflexi bacterium]|nr:VWA domain-containing protein [Chloroflexota bacterium]